MKIVLYYDHYPVCSGAYIKRAFERLGHEVRSYGRPKGTQIWGGHVALRHINCPDAWDYDFVPDLQITCDSDDYYTTAIPDMCWGGVPDVVWGVDNHVREYGIINNPPDNFDHYFFAHNFCSCVDLRNHGNVTWLPCGYDPIWHYPPEGETFDEREYDFGIVGVLYPRRMALIRYLSGAKRDNWRFFYGHGYINEMYRLKYHATKIALNDSVAFDLNQRFFEAAAMGCAILTEEVPDLRCLITEGYISDHHIVTYSNLSDAYEQARYIKGFVDANGGPKKEDMNWLTEHTWDARAAELLEVVGRMGGDR